jgi:hypothetical protein
MSSGTPGSMTDEGRSMKKVTEDELWAGFAITWTTQRDGPWIYVIPSGDWAYPMWMSETPFEGDEEDSPFGARRFTMEMTHYGAAQLVHLCRLARAQIEATDIDELAMLYVAAEGFIVGILNTTSLQIAPTTPRFSEPGEPSSQVETR